MAGGPPQQHQRGSIGAQVYESFYDFFNGFPQLFQAEGQNTSAPSASGPSGYNNHPGNNHSPNHMGGGYGGQGDPMGSPYGAANMPPDQRGRGGGAPGGPQAGYQDRQRGDEGSSRRSSSPMGVGHRTGGVGPYSGDTTPGGGGPSRGGAQQPIRGAGAGTGPGHHGGGERPLYVVDKEDLLDQHVAYYLRHHPQIHQRHALVRKRPGVYELNDREINVEWQYATDPGGQGYLVVVDGPLRQPFNDYMEMTEANAEYDTQGIKARSALHLIPREQRMSFGDGHKAYTRLEAMKVAKEQALVRERAADYVREGRLVPQDLMTGYEKTIKMKLGGNSQRPRPTQQGSPGAQGGGGPPPQGGGPDQKPAEPPRGDQQQQGQPHNGAPPPGPPQLPPQTSRGAPPGGAAPAPQPPDLGYAPPSPMNAQRGGQSPMGNSGQPAAPPVAFPAWGGASPMGSAPAVNALTPPNLFGVAPTNLGFGGQYHPGGVVSR